MKEKISTSVKQTSTDIKTITKNGTRLIEALALLIVAGYAIINTLPSTRGVTVASAVLLTAGLIIFLRGTAEFLKHLANK